MNPVLLRRYAIEGLRWAVMALTCAVAARSEAAALIPYAVLGMAMGAEPVEAPQMTREPADVVVEFRKPFTLSAAASGRDLRYQWQKDNPTGGFTNLLRATNSTYSVTTPTNVHAGWYQVIVSNIAGTATSRAARVDVIPDEAGPALRSAALRPYPLYSPYQVEVQFSEDVDVTSARMATNYRVQEIESGLEVPMQLLGFPVGPKVILRTTNWNTQVGHMLTVNNVKDRFGNGIAPNSRVGISFTRTTPLVTMDQCWRWNEEGLDLGTAWRTNQLEGTWYGEGPGAFRSAAAQGSPCSGTWKTLISIGPVTHYFTTEFVVPDVEAETVLELHALADDGWICYLNGLAIASGNMPTPLDSVSAGTLATAGVTIAACLTNIVGVTHLLSGTNVLAVEVHQSAAASTDVVFGFEVLGHLSYRQALPDPPVPRLEIVPQELQATLWWDGGGYVLEAAGQIEGPWKEVQPGMANPYVTPLDESTNRFWRLKLK